MRFASLGSGSEGNGLVVTARPVPASAAHPTGHRMRLAITGGDRPGIVRDVSRILSERGVNVEELESQMASAPMSGEPMFVASFYARSVDMELGQRLFDRVIAEGQAELSALKGQ